ncbi:hypothetical protein ACQPW3_01780 [Actinosynnema sp. CA-248983]
MVRHVRHNASRMRSAASRYCGRPDMRARSSSPHAMIAPAEASFTSCGASGER